MAKRSKYWDRMVDIIDEHFPKGESKERGAALVALAYIEMMLQDDERGTENSRIFKGE